MTNPDALALSVELDRSAIAKSTTSRVHLVAEVKAIGAAVEQERAPLTVVFALDTSGSMMGPPIEYVIRSAEKLIDLLRPTDKVGMISFSDTASIVSEPLMADEEAKTVLKRRIRSLRAAGDTNVGDALEQARLILMAAAQKDAVLGRRAILLLSDGQPTRGLVAKESLAQLARSIRKEVAVSTLGYGDKHDDLVLSAISDAGGGSYHFIRDPAVCQFELSKALGAQAEIVADRIDLHLRPAAGVEIVKLHLEAVPRFGADGLAIQISDLPENARRLIAIELSIVAGAESMRMPVAEIALGFRNAGERELRRIAQSMAIDVRHDAGTPIESALHKVLLVCADEARIAARALADRGQYRGAAEVLRRMMAEIEAAPGYIVDDGAPLYEAHEQLLDEAQVFEQNPDPESYQKMRRGQRSMLGADGVDALNKLRSKSDFAKSLDLAVSGQIANAWLRREDGSRIPIEREAIIGRSKTADIHIASPSLSRQHAQVFPLEGDYFIADLGSSNGVCVNGRRIDDVHKLEHGDRINLGNEEMTFEKNAKD